MKVMAFEFAYGVIAVSDLDVHWQPAVRDGCLLSPSFLDSTKCPMGALSQVIVQDIQLSKINEMF